MLDQMSLDIDLPRALPGCSCQVASFVVGLDRHITAVHRPSTAACHHPELHLASSTAELRRPSGLACLATGLD